VEPLPALQDDVAFPPWRSSLSTDPRSPVIIGVGQLLSNRGRSVEGAREPLDLVREALAQAATAEQLRSADAVYAVHIASWAYDNLASQVARAVGSSAATLVDTVLGGHLPVRLLDQAAARIWAGDSEVALLVGGEAQASVTLLGKAGIDPVSLGWSAEPGGPPGFGLDQLGSAGMQAAQLFQPTRVYPLYENRLQADLGQTPAEALAWSAQIYADLSTVAAAHPSAWNPVALTPEQVTAGRLVCEPYPLGMNAMPHVDQAAALVVTSWAKAQEWGIADVVHVWGGAGADDNPDILQRKDFSGSPAMRMALDRCLEQGGVTATDLAFVDVYTCFPVVPKLAALHLGLPRDQVLSVTGGHSSFGGPLNSYSVHSLATAVGALRDGGVGLVHANGGYLTYQHAVLLSSVPHPDGYVGQPAPQAAAEGGAPALLSVDGALDVVVETLTVEHSRDGEPRQAFLVARTATGERIAVCSAVDDVATPKALSLDALPDGLTTHVGRSLPISVEGGAFRLR
jgi:acetyl-CoA C-acetyltransferase